MSQSYEPSDRGKAALPIRGGNNAAMVAATGAKVIAYANAKDRIAEMDRGGTAGDIVENLDPQTVFLKLRELRNTW